MTEEVFFSFSVVVACSSISPRFVSGLNPSIAQKVTASQLVGMTYNLFFLLPSGQYYLLGHSRTPTSI